MKEFIETYNKYQEDIEYFLKESLRNLGDISYFEKNDFIIYKYNYIFFI